MSVLSVRALSIAHEERLVVQSFDWTVQAGEKWAVLGVNGAGKSSVIHALLGLNRQGSTHVQLNGVPLSDLSARQQAASRVYVPQRYDEPFTVTVWQALQSVVPDADVMQCEDALSLFGLSGRANAWVHTLSGGERQRLTWAFAHVRSNQQTCLGLFDEPLSAQDLAWQQRLLERLKNLPYAVVAAVHDLNHVTQFASHVLLLAPDGATGVSGVSAQGRFDEVMQEKLLSMAFGVSLKRDASRSHWRTDSI
jgi:iron complex transport system ATP-binding protein